MKLPSEIRIVEVGPRDGLQNEVHFLPTKDKIQLIEKLVAAGITEIEATSFVHPKWIPNLADAEEVLLGIQKLKATFFALVPNRKGFERAVKSGVDGITWTLSTTDSHSKSNLNRTTEESLNEIQVLVKEANELGLKSRASIATIFGCPFEGAPKFDRVLWVIDRLVEASCTRIGLSDTLGVANPPQIYEWMKEIIDRYPQTEFELHLHNTYGRGLANVMAGIYAGVKSFDSSIGGLGGCPYAPGATGNISTEDLLDMMNCSGIQTGIDINVLLAASNLISECFQKPLDSQVFKARARQSSGRGRAADRQSL